ncbi:hypothetical protein RA272_27805, partial [Pseudomonas syringae pv. tagetis]|uniref:hypothetical protein n=1 Tax=Pseudomonas syringae group genomosp. 7 TaxID=251699 RepID=UPI00376F77BD
MGGGWGVVLGWFGGWGGGVVLWWWVGFGGGVLGGLALVVLVDGGVGGCVVGGWFVVCVVRGGVVGFSVCWWGVWWGVWWFGVLGWRFWCFVSLFVWCGVGFAVGELVAERC